MRLGLWPWILLGALFTVGQGVVLAYGQGALWLAVAAIVVLQVVKAGLSAMRLTDLGLEPIRATLTLVPIVNLFLLGTLAGRTPPKVERDRRRAAWAGRGSSVSALGHSGAVLARSAALVVPLCLVYGAVFGLAEAVVPSGLASLIQGDPQVLVVWFQGTLALFGASALYLFVQVLKRRTASRATWLPALFVLPTGLFSLALWDRLLPVLGANAMTTIGYAAFGLLVWIVLGGIVQPLWIHLADDGLRHGGRPSISRAVSAWRAVAIESLVVHGGVATVVFMGMQALFIPGILLAIAMAYAVHGATLHRVKRPVGQSRRLTLGDSLRVTFVLSVGMVLTLAAQLGMPVLVEFIYFLQGTSSFVEGGEFYPKRVFMSALFALTLPGGVALPPVGVGLGAAVSTAAWALSLGALTELYHERRAALDIAPSPLRPSASSEASQT